MLPDEISNVADWLSKNWKQNKHKMIQVSQKNVNSIILVKEVQED